MRDCQDSLLHTGGLGVVEGRINVDSTKDHSFENLSCRMILLCFMWSSNPQNEIRAAKKKREQLVLCSMTVSALWDRITNSKYFKYWRCIPICGLQKNQEAFGGIRLSAWHHYVSDLCVFFKHFKGKRKKGRVRLLYSQPGFPPGTQLQRIGSSLLLVSGWGPVNRQSGNWAAECAQSELLKQNIYWKAIKSPLWVLSSSRKHWQFTGPDAIHHNHHSLNSMYEFL